MWWDFTDWIVWKKDININIRYVQYYYLVIVIILVFKIKVCKYKCKLNKCIQYEQCYYYYIILLKQHSVLYWFNAVTLDLIELIELIGLIELTRDLWVRKFGAALVTRVVATLKFQPFRDANLYHLNYFL